MSEEKQSQGTFSTLEIDTIGEIMNISMGSAATAASTMLDNKVSITTPEVELIPKNTFEITQYEPAIAVNITYVEGIKGSNILVLKKEDMRAILTQLMSSEPKEGFEKEEIAQSAICELMNQMMGSSATVLSCFLGRTINISTPDIIEIDKADDFKNECFKDTQELVKTEFSLLIENVIDSKFISVMSPRLAKEIIDVSLNFDSSAVGEYMDTQKKDNIPVPASGISAIPGIAAPMEPPVMQNPERIAVQQPSAQPVYAPQPMYASPVIMKDFEYTDFSPENHSTVEVPANIDLVMNVSVVVTAELGRTKRKIKDILEFGQGTIVELDKQAGAQVDVVCNGELIARGDVVVVDDNFSVRITEILQNRQNLAAIK